ncbi:MAG: FAD-binding oxidoreductase [Bacteroidota bacterium]|nr:FAD-binding oxidoreductase [Bacteroidota bacterium]
MADTIVKIISIEPVTHNIKRFTVEKPKDYSFHPGQATEVSINTPELKEEKRPFTFTCLPEDDHLEFTIKIYTGHNGVTNALGNLKTGNELIVRDVWGAIEYKGAGVFLAGGAGVTPFIAIFRHLYNTGKVNGNKLIFSNKTSKDIILKDEFEKILGENFLTILTEENDKNFEHGRINEEYIKKNISNFQQHFYICGPDAFVKDISETLAKLGAATESVVFEK